MLLAAYLSCKQSILKERGVSGALDAETRHHGESATKTHFGGQSQFTSSERHQRDALKTLDGRRDGCAPARDARIES